MKCLSLFPSTAPRTSSGPWADVADDIGRRRVAHFAFPTTGLPPDPPDTPEMLR